MMNKKQMSRKSQLQQLLVLCAVITGLCATTPLFAHKTAAKTAEGTSAKEVVLKARHARAVWHQFPGYIAHVTISHNGDVKKGVIGIDADGAVNFEVEGVQNEKKIIGKIKSLVGHRLPSKERELHVTFTDECTTHPQGRLVSFKDDRMGSQFRIKDDVITEVYRKIEDIRFVISVVDVNRSKEGKVLPRSYSVSTWDTISGNLMSSSVVNCTWKRVGQFDLPLRIVTISTKDNGKHDVQVLEFSNHKLQSGAAKKAAKPETSTKN